MTVEELEEYGMERMEDDRVERFLSSHSLGVLGLPTEDEPYLLPMSYGYDGGARLYFYFIVSDQSRKVKLLEQAETVSFLVYAAETMFNWQSVSLTGTVEELPAEKRAELTGKQEPRWRPEFFETASETERTRLYEFRIDDWAGIEHASLPPGFQQQAEKPD